VAAAEVGEFGQDPPNKFAGSAMRSFFKGNEDCFVALLLAMTGEEG